MAKSSLRLDTRRPLKDGTYPVQIAVGNGTNIYLGTGIYAKETEWNAISQQFTGKSGKRVNSALSAMLSSVTLRILELRENGMWKKLSRAQIKEMLTDMDLESPTIGFPSLGEVLDKMVEGRKENTKRITHNARLKLDAFCGDVHKVRLDSINRAWIEDFYNSMPDISINTKAIYMRILRRAMNWALDREYVKSNPFRTYRIPLEETRMRVLTIDKMRQFKDMSLPYKYGEYRDIFMLSFYLIGINTVDLSELTEKNIVNGRLEYRRAKTSKLYSIKIEPEAMEIINRYRGKKRLLSCFERYKDYKDFQGTVNNALSRVGVPVLDEKGKFVYLGNHHKAMQPLQEGLTLYWARYSWATYAAELDIPKDTISEALGHSYGAKVTGVYIKFSQNKIDAANRKVIDYVLNKIPAPILTD